jgi:uncharacterized HAD superfamily protein
MTMRAQATLSIDFDGVITDPHALKASELRRLGYEVDLDQVQRHYVVERLGIPLSVYEEAARRANCVRIDEVPLASGAFEALRALHALDLRLVIVTARSPSECQSVQAFVARHQLPIAEVRTSHGGSKAASLAGMFPLFHLDDTPAHLEQIRRLLDIEVLLFRNVANAWWLDEFPDLFTAVDWPGVVRRAERLLARHLHVQRLGKENGCRASS